MKWAPHPYQKRAVSWVLKKPGCGLFLKPG